MKPVRLIFFRKLAHTDQARADSAQIINRHWGLLPDDEKTVRVCSFPSLVVADRLVLAELLQPVQEGQRSLPSSIRGRVEEEC